MLCFLSFKLAPGFQNPLELEISKHYNANCKDVHMGSPRGNLARGKMRLLEQKSRLNKGRQNWVRETVTIHPTKLS